MTGQLHQVVGICLWQFDQSSNPLQLHRSTPRQRQFKTNPAANNVLTIVDYGAATLLMSSYVLNQVTCAGLLP